MATLEVTSGVSAGRQFELIADQSVIGRYPFCDIVLEDHSVSREHAQIIHNADGYFIEDLNSLNGTFINGHRIAGRTQLSAGDRIRFYLVEATFHTGSPPTEPVAARTKKQSSADAADQDRGDTAATCLVGSAPTLDDAPDRQTVYEKLQAVLDFTRSLGASLAIDEIMPKILDSLFRIFPQTTRGYILRGQESDGRLTPFVIRHRHDESGPPPTFGPLNQALAQRVLAAGRAMLVNDDSPDVESVIDQDFRSTICAPIMGPSQRPLGVIHIDTNDARRRFTEEDLEVLISLSAVAGQAVEFVLLHQARMQADRRKRELSMARQVQFHFLPERVPTAPGYEFFRHYEPAQEVGGDYYGFIPLAGDRIAVAIGDVAGKGVSAALLMARLCAEVRYSLASTASPAEAVSLLAREMGRSAEELGFITFLLVVLDWRRHELAVVNAGHMPPLVRRAARGIVEPIGAETSGLPLGFDLQHQYETATLPFEPGDVMLMYTDGLSEAMNNRGEVFSNRRLSELLANGHQEVEALGRGLLTDLRRFIKHRPLNDDCCVLLVRRVETS